MDPLPHMREHIDLVEATTRPAKLETTPLPYGLKDLDPVMSEATLDYHFEHLAKGSTSVTRSNSLITPWRKHSPATRRWMSMEERS